MSKPRNATSQSVEWYTPRWLFDELDREFHFTLDPCATLESAKCARFYDEAQNGLLQSWNGECVFMNPPYGSQVIGAWIEKARFATENGGCPLVVGLVPSYTESDWWHDHIWNRAEVRFIRGRISFKPGAPRSAGGAPFASAIIVWIAPRNSGNAVGGPSRGEEP